MSVPSWPSWLIALLFAATACGDLDLTGKLCSAARPCPSGWDCSSGTCHAAGTGNAISNGGFESAVSGWTASHATLAATTPGRTSAHAAQWNPDGTADSVLTLLTAAVDAPADDDWCAVAWVKAPDTAAVTLTLLRSGEVLGESGEAITAGVWTRLEAKGLALFAKPLSVSLTSLAAAGARQIQVDDVAVWKAPTSLCTTPP